MIEILNKMSKKYNEIKMYVENELNLLNDTRYAFREVEIESKLNYAHVLLKMMTDDCEILIETYKNNKGV